MSDGGLVAVRPIPRTTWKGALAALVPAFWDYPETTHLLPDERRRRRVLARYLACDCADSLIYGSLLGAWVNGTIVGAAAWLPPEAYPISSRRQVAQAVRLVPALPWGAAAAREAMRGRAANRRHHPTHEPHYYLRALGVSPAHQGSGVGSALMRPILLDADAREVGCFLTTATRRNVPYYEQFGFAVLAEYRPTTTWPHVWSMWRAPQVPSRPMVEPHGADGDP